MASLGKYTKELKTSKNWRSTNVTSPIRQTSSSSISWRKGSTRNTDKKNLPVNLLDFEAAFEQDNCLFEKFLDDSPAENDHRVSIVVF